jgi:gliding motility-associated lipoprotein GldH
MTRSFYILLLSLFILSSCDTNTILKDNYDIPDAKWLIKDSPAFDFEITDIQATYNVFYNVRNNRNYLYHNLYLTHYLTAPDGKVIHQHLDEIILFDQVTGKPSGEGLGDIYDHKVLAFKDFKFPFKGKYKIKISQYMRQNPLLDVVSAGFSIEKNTP